VPTNGRSFENRIEVHPFTEDGFRRLLGEGSCGTAPVEQVRYLARYCTALGAKSLVVERLYVDRHFMDEYALYYSTVFASPGNSVERVHVFSCDLTDEGLGRFFARALECVSGKDEVERELQPHYCGFIAVRPIPSVPIGRTILTPLRRDTVWVDQQPHTVHLGNIGLEVAGIPFQQQDIGVGACATAALWAALAPVSRLDGRRAPTPAEITETAARHLAAVGRSLPARAGLTVVQLSDAIRAAGFAPEHIQVIGKPEMFAFALATYVRSGIPVLLELRNADGGHAMTAVGYRLATSSHREFEAPVPTVSRRLSRVFVHDDRMGPYARATLVPLPATANSIEGVALEIAFDDQPGVPPERWLVASGLVPVYPKLRLPAESLFDLLWKHDFLIMNVAGAARVAGLEAECRYERAGSYLAGLAGRVPWPDPTFIRRVALSRWCAVVQWQEQGRPLVEFVYDTTDIVRPASQGTEFLRAIVSLDPALTQKFAEQARGLGVPST
jgi:hypothetical protein